MEYEEGKKMEKGSEKRKIDDGAGKVKKREEKDDKRRGSGCN